MGPYFQHRSMGVSSPSNKWVYGTNIINAGINKLLMNWQINNINQRIIYVLADKYLINRLALKLRATNDDCVSGYLDNAQAVYNIH